MVGKKSLVGLAVCGLVAVTAGCGPSGGAAGGGDGKKLTIALPFDSCLAWWPLYAAQQQGGFKKAKVSVSMQGVDGSAAAIQAMLSGKAQIALTAPDNYLSAAAKDADITGWYAFYQKPTFSLVTPKSSGFSSVKDLAGKTIGISTPGGGDVTYMETLMSQAGMVKGKDYKELAVGDGASAATALKKGAVSAYAASYFDRTVIADTGMALNTLTYSGYPESAGIIMNSTKKWSKDNSAVTDKFGKAVANATAWGLNHPADIATMCAKVNPEESKDKAFAKEIITEVSNMVRPSAEVNGKYGRIDARTWSQYRTLLLQLKIVGDGAKDADVDNSHVSAWNS